LKHKLDTTFTNWCSLPTSLGEFRMYDSGDDSFRLVCVGDIRHQGTQPLLRVHSSCVASELFDARDCDCADQLREAMKRIATEQRGIICHIYQEGRGHGLSTKIRAVGVMQRLKVDTVESFEHLGISQDVRAYEDVIEVLKSLGINSVRLITNNPRKREFLTNAGIHVDVVRTHPISRAENHEYLSIKKAKLGHTLHLESEPEGTSAPILFYHSDQAWGWLSNFSDHAIFMHELIWPSVEHYYQAMKFVGTADEVRIRLADTPMQAKRIADELGRSLRKTDWDDVKEQVMLDALLAKFRQHPNLGKMLARTAERTLVEHSTHDSYWGDGGDGTGKNRLGTLLMQVRSVLRNSHDMAHGESRQQGAGNCVE
jgi:GTP cyclohydrolase II